MMERALLILNQLEKEGILERYAIGGAMAAMFYVEPTATYDLDIFAVLPLQGGLISLSPLYQALRDRGYREDGECIMIEGVPVQFLSAYDTLIEEALTDAREMTYKNIPTRVLRAEHLAAICLKTGRQKDRERIRLFIEAKVLNFEELHKLLKRHGLEAKWNLWTR